MPKILLIEDEIGIRMTLADRLTAEGYEVEQAGDGKTGYERGREGGIDLIVLDLMLPGKPGLEVCRDLRAEGVSTPLLMVTAKGQLSDKIQGLRTGADDYMVKPFEMLELLARLEALIRRDRVAWPTPEPEDYRFGDVRLDPKQAAAFRRGKRLKLSAKEYHLLLYFLEHPRQTLSRDVLLRDVWKYRSGLSTRTVDVHVGWLRQKIEEDSRKPRWIVTRHGLGYIFDPE